MRRRPCVPGIGLARRALVTERPGEYSVRWTTGQPAEHKAMLLYPELVSPGPKRKKRVRMSRTPSQLRLPK